MSSVILDCEAEEAMYRDPEGAKWIAREILTSPIEQIVEEFPQSPFAHEKYSSLHLQHLRCPMPQDERVRTQDVLEFADQNVRMRTRDPDLLVQRYFFDREGLGETSRWIKPPHKQPPIHSVLKAQRSRNTRAQNRETQQMAEALEEKINKLRI